jgi:glutathione S-transferase
MARILVHIPQSPFSEKARWALDHHAVRVVALEHLPLVYEPLLRLATRAPGRKVTVPILFDGAQVFADSLEIAQHAENVGTGAPLFPAAAAAAVFHWERVAERLMLAGRARVMERLIVNPVALTETLPSALHPLSAVLGSSAKLGAAFVMSKYATRAGTGPEHEAVMAGVLEQIENAVSTADHLVDGTFTFADLAIASSLGFVTPARGAPFSAEAREAWTEPRLVAAFPRALAWRDRIYERYRH